MKTFLKLIIVAVVLNGAYQGGMSAWKYSQLKDSTHSSLILGEKVPTERLQQGILTRAKELNLPVAAENVIVTRENLRTAVRVSYRDQIELFPGYRYPHDYSFNDEVAPIR
jgi:hypothetical protein